MGVYRVGCCAACVADAPHADRATAMPMQMVNSVVPAEAGAVVLDAVERGLAVKHDVEERKAFADAAMAEEGLGALNSPGAKSPGGSRSPGGRSRKSISPKQSPHGGPRTVRIVAGSTAGRGQRLGDDLVTRWSKPQVDPPKDFAIADVQKHCPLEPGAPPETIDAEPFLQRVCTKVDPAISQCSPTFRKYFKDHFVSKPVKEIMVDAFWYCFVELFELNAAHKAEHNTVLHDRLGRAFATFCWNVEPSKNKDFFLQYFPYCLVAAITYTFKATFPGSAKQLEPEDEFSDYINAIVCELFVHDSGSPHGQKLRTLMRANLFKPGEGGLRSAGGTRKPRRRKTHRWMDIERPGTGVEGGRYSVTATRPAQDLLTAKSPQAEFDENFEQNVYSDHSFHDVEVPQRPMTGAADVEDWLSCTSPLIDYFLKATSDVPLNEQELINSTIRQTGAPTAGGRGGRRRMGGTLHRDDVRGLKPMGSYSKQAAYSMRVDKQGRRNYEKNKRETAVELEESKAMLKREQRKIRTARRSVLLEGRRAVKSFSNDIIGIQRRRSGLGTGEPEKQEELPGGVVLESIGGDFDFDMDPGEEQLAKTQPKDPKPQWLINLQKQNLPAA